MPAAIPSPRLIRHALAPTIAVARIIWPLHHDDGAWAINDRPLNDHDTALNPPVDDIVVITTPAMPIARIDRSCADQRSERHKADKARKRRLDLHRVFMAVIPQQGEPTRILRLPR